MLWPSLLLELELELESLESLVPSMVPKSASKMLCFDSTSGGINHFWINWFAAETQISRL